MCASTITPTTQTLNGTVVPTVYTTHRFEPSCELVFGVCTTPPQGMPTLCGYADAAKRERTARHTNTIRALMNLLSSRPTPHSGNRNCASFDFNIVAL